MCCILYNKLDFAGYSGSDDYEKFNCITKVLTFEFQDINKHIGHC